MLILNESMFKKPIYTILEMKKMGKRTGELPIIDSVRTPMEAALKMPFRHIKAQPFKDRNKYGAEHCRRMRTMNGVGVKRNLHSSHQQHFNNVMERWKEAA